MQAARVVYRSTNGDTEAPTVVSGSVFAPVGPAPEGGWPVVALAHGTTGIQEPCAPSLSDSLLDHVSVVSGFSIRRSVWANWRAAWGRVFGPPSFTSLSHSWADRGLATTQLRTA